MEGITSGRSRYFFPELFGGVADILYFCSMIDYGADNGGGAESLRDQSFFPVESGIAGFLNRENIERSADGVEYHPLHPFLPENARVLFLGSFPPQRKRWCVDFFYPNFINDHWRIEGEVFWGDREHFVDKEARRFRLPEIVEHCRNRGIAFYDTATGVRRLKDNASDKFLEVVVPTDIGTLTGRLRHLRAVITTGEKATETICRYYGLEKGPKVGEWVRLDGQGLELYRLPSSSRAYPLAFEKKAEAYRRMFERYLP